MKEYNYSLKACIECVEFEIETLHKNPFEELGRAIIRAKQDAFFNKTMIEAWEKYIMDHNIRWNNEGV